MSSWFDWPTLREQCCDAETYLEEGARCAAGEGCYGELRPLGSQLWFGCIDALGLQPGALIWMHGLLLLLSLGFSVRVARRWLPKHPQGGVSRWVLIGCAGLSLLAHWIFLQPVFPHSLADPPAALLSLIAIWLILLSTAQSGWWWHALIGLLLGLAAFVRAYYLYPVLGWLALGLLCWTLDRGRRWRELLIAVALLPIAIQFIATWRETGAFSYIDPGQSQKWKTLHLGDGSKGYDTLLHPIEAFRWPSDCSADNLGLQQALDRRDLGLAVCVVAGRLQFYFGSYAATTFLTPRKQVLDRFDDVDPAGGIDVLGVRVDFRAARSPDGRQAASRLSVLAPEPTVGLRQAFVPRFSGSYSYSVWLWSEQPAEVELRFYRRSDRTLVARTLHRLQPQPQRVVVAGAPLDDSEHVILVGGGTDSVASWGRAAGDSLLLWGGKLERGEQPKAWTPSADPRLGEARRIWSPAILIAHGAAAAVLLFSLLSHWRALGRREWVGMALLGLLFAEGLVIVPEQRFLIVPQIVGWTLCGYLLLRRLATTMARPRTVPSRA